MNISVFCALVLIFCNLGILSVSPHDRGSYASTAETLWGEHLSTFQECLKTDPDAARAELQKVAQSLFKGHLLVDEWVPLYFRIHKDGTKYPSDLKRVHELEFRMLTAMDAKTYAKQIQHHRAALEHYTALETAVGDELLLTEKLPASGQPHTDTRKVDIQDASEKQHVKTAFQYYKTFFRLLATDKEAART